MDEAGMQIAPGLRVPESALRFQFSRGSGPGGQNVNKVNTRAELWVQLDALAAAGMTHRAIGRLKTLAGRRITIAGEIQIASEIHRSQEQNRQETLAKLRELIVTAMVEPKPRRKTRPSRGSKERRIGEKKRRGEIKARRQGRNE